MTSNNKKIDLSKIQTFDKQSTWTKDKKAYLEQAQKDYPLLDLYFIEIIYDFCKEHEDDTVLFKYMQGKTEHLKQNQIDRCDNIIGNLKLERNKVVDEIHTVEIKKLT